MVKKSMSFKAKWIGLIYLLFLLVLYYSLGPGAFPDYENYVRIVESIRNGNPIIGFEFLPSVIFDLLLYLVDDARLSVDLYVLMLHAFYLSWITRDTVKSNELSWGKVFFTAILGPLILTSTIRAAPAYIAVGYFIFQCKSKITFNEIIILLIGLLSHNSALIMAFILFISLAFRWKALGKKIEIMLIIFGGGIGVGLDISNQAVIQFLNIFDFGGRAVYIEEKTSASIAKNLYWLFVGLFVYGVIKKRDNEPLQNNIMMLAYLIISIIYSFNNVVGIRMTYFIIGAGVLIRGGFLVSYNYSSISLRIIDLFIASAVFGFSIADILSNTGKF